MLSDGENMPLRSDQVADRSWRRDPRLAACLVAIVLLLVGTFGSNGGGYYTFLRIYICGAAAILAFAGWQRGQVWWPLSGVLVAILFNPIRPIEMERDDWFWPDIVTAAWFGAVGLWPYVRAPRKIVAWGAAAFILAMVGILAIVRLGTGSRDYNANTMNADMAVENAAMTDTNLAANADEAAAAINPVDRLADAFGAATGHREPFTQLEDGELVTTKPIKIISLPFGPALLTSREIKDGCHACQGSIGVYYLKDVGGKTTVTGSWPKAVEGWGWGAPPEWQSTDKFTSYPAIYASGGFTGQGITESSSTLTELTPAGPITSDLIGTGYTDEGAIVDDERPACVLEGKIANIRKDRSFDVVVTGTKPMVNHYLKKGGKFVALSKVDWGLPCG